MARQAQSPVLELGPYTLDRRACELRDPAGQPLPLRPQALAMLLYLAERPGQLVPKQELMEALWPDVVVTEDSLVQCAVSVRRALGTWGDRLLRTVPRRGYRLDPASAPDLTETAGESAFEQENRLSRSRDNTSIV